MNDTNQVATTSLEERISDRIDKSVANALTVSERAGGVGFSNAGQAMEFAKMMAISGISVPKHLRGNPGACLAIVIQAIEWRLSPFAVANKSYSVNDRIAYESQLIQAVILQRAPILGRLKVEYTGDGQERRCRVWAKLKETKEIVEYTSPPLGNINPKNSPLWKSDPDQQLFYYSGRSLCRRHFPDVILGVYARDEIEDGRDPEDAVDVTPVAVTRTLTDKLDALAANGKEQDSTKATEGDATVAKADEAAAAGNQVGQSAPAAAQSTAAIPTAEEKAAAMATFTKAVTSAAPKQESAPAAAQAPARTGLTEAARTGLRQVHEDMMSAMSKKKVEAIFKTSMQSNEIGEDDPIYVAAAKIRDAHVKRVGGDSSPSEADQVVRGVLG